MATFTELTNKGPDEIPANVDNYFAKSIADNGGI